MRDLRAALGEIAATGADAAIVQDLGVAAMVRREFPALALHASTQMAICNAEGARLARSLGFSRVVLARECSLEDAHAVAETGIETEVFVHGALCTAVSGRCLMSSMSGGRSGNRGRCAQPCRQSFRMDGMQGPLLSLRDLCLLDDLPVLCASGVRSLKVEGRLKSPEYVAVVTSVYRRALDAVAQGNFRPDPVQREQLLQIFNRGGFTRGHILGAEDADLVTPDRVSHEGLPLGKVQAVKGRLAALHVDRALHDGDSLQLRGAGESYDLRYSGPDIPAGGTASLRLRPDAKAKPGMQVARLADALPAGAGSRTCAPAHPCEHGGPFCAGAAHDADPHRRRSERDGNRPRRRCGQEPSLHRSGCTPPVGQAGRHALCARGGKPSASDGG